MQVLGLIVVLQKGFILLHAATLAASQYQSVHRRSHQPPMVDMDSDTALPVSLRCSAS